MFKQVVEINCPEGVTKETISSLLFDRDLELAKQYLAVCDTFAERGDIWFTHVESNTENNKIILTRIFDTENAMTQFNEEISPFRATWPVQIITSEEITFEQFAAFASENDEFEPLDIPE